MTGSGSILWKLILSLIQMSRGKQWFCFLIYFLIVHMKHEERSQIFF